MSASVILKNIFKFAQILGSACCESASQWDDQSLENALSWASYCQELATQIKGQSYEDDVNCHLGQMTVLLEPVSCLRLSIESLCCARALLVEYLVSNPRFPPASHRKLATILQKHPDGVKILQEVRDKLSKPDDCIQVLTDLLNANQNHLVSIKSQNQTKVFMQHLLSAVGNVKKMERLDMFCASVFKKLTETQHGWNIVVGLFTLDVGDTPHTMITTDFLSRMKSSLQQDVDASYLWTVPAEVLIRAACANEQFFLFYLHAVIALGNSYVPQIYDGGMHWRSESGRDIKELSLHIQKLLESSVSPEKQIRILEAVTGCVRETGLTVWSDLVHQLLSVFKHVQSRAD